MIWTPEIVRARFVEAVDTIRRMPSQSYGGSAGFWPAYVHTFEDMNGWGTRRLAEERAMHAKRVRATADAVSRYDEVMRWNAEIIPTIERRNIVWAWARCRMYGDSFAAECEARKWKRVTAYRRLFSTIDLIVDRLAKSGVPCRLPAENWLLQEHPKSDTDLNTMGLGDVEPPPPISPTSMMLPGAKPVDTLKTDADILGFTQFLRSTNSKRRKQNERRRKSEDQGAA